MFFSLIPRFHTEITQKSLVKMNRKGLEVPSFWRQFIKLHQMISPGKAEVAGFKNIFLSAIVHDHRARYLVSEHMVGYKLLPFPAACNVTGISYRRFFILLRHYSNL